MRKRSWVLEFGPLLVMAALLTATLLFAEKIGAEKVRPPRPQWQLCQVVGNKIDHCRDATDGDSLDILLVSLGLKPGWAVWRRK